MPETKTNRVLSWMGMALTVSAFTSTIIGGLIWMFEPHIETFIIDVIEKKKPSTRAELSKEMAVRPELVTIELGKMYKGYHETEANIKAFNQTWIPHLEKEKVQFHVGFFVSIEEDKDKVKYRDFDGEIYPCWNDEQGWYYMKQGYKYYQ